MSKQIFPIEIINNTAESHFIEKSKTLNSVYIASLILLLTAVVVFPLISIDITSQSRGIIKTRHESSPIQTVKYGLVDFNIITEGLHVSKGDTLLVLNTDNINEQILQLKNIKHNNVQFIRDLEHLISQKTDMLTPKYRHELIQYQSKQQEFNIKLRLYKKDYDVSHEAYEFGAIAEMEYLQKKNIYNAALAERDLYKKECINKWEATETKLYLDNNKLDSDIKKQKKEKAQYTITSPLKGTIYKTKGYQTGSYLSPGQSIAYISPDEEIIAECYVKPYDIGYIRLNQNVNFQIDAFDYNQWGLIKGKVISISDDIILDNNTPVFKVQCSLSQKFLTLKSGYRGNLKKGMSLTGRFYMNNRTLFQLLYDKMDDWLNPKTNKNFTK